VSNMPLASLSLGGRRCVSDRVEHPPLAIVTSRRRPERLTGRQENVKTSRSK
jgi:hypothetical protein